MYGGYTSSHLANHICMHSNVSRGSRDMHILTHDSYMHATKRQKMMSANDYSYFENLKCFVAQTVGPMQKSFSHKKGITTRALKLDRMLDVLATFSIQKVIMLAHILKRQV